MNYDIVTIFVVFINLLYFIFGKPPQLNKIYSLLIELNNKTTELGNQVEKMWEHIEEQRKELTEAKIKIAELSVLVKKGGNNADQKYN